MQDKRNKEIFLEEQEEFAQNNIYLLEQQMALEQEYWNQFKPEAIVEHTLTSHKPEENGEENKLPF